MLSSGSNACWRNVTYGPSGPASKLGWSAIDQPTVGGSKYRHNGAIHPALGGAVLSDIGKPQPVKPVGVEAAVPPVLTDCSRRLVMAPAAPEHSLAREPH